MVLIDYGTIRTTFLTPAMCAGIVMMMGAGANELPENTIDQIKNSRRLISSLGLDVVIHSFFRSEDDVVGKKIF